jgi:hypothetical protein
MIYKIIKYLTPKKKPMSTKAEENKQHQAEVKKIIKALTHSNDVLKALQKQFSFDAEHFVSKQIASNEKLIASYNHE